MPPPVMVQPHGPRYKLDRAQKYISWMGFTFYLSTSRATGVSLFDVRFNNTRVIYSLELQEALSHYAGSDPAHGGLWYFDSLFGMGISQVELVPGYDCPIYADYLNASYCAGNSTRTIRNSICIFEYTADHPISRHTSPFSTSVSRNTYLVVRAVSTVGNYDYQLDYIFYLDGTIEVKYRASGYIISAFHPPWPGTGDNEYGYRIHDTISSSIHTHVLNFRADLDIGGSVNNTLQLASLTPYTTSYPWDQPEIPERNTMHLVHSNITHETPLNWPTNSATQYLLTNLSPNDPDTPNPPAYLIHPGSMPASPVSLQIHNSTSLSRSAYWSTHPLYILAQHDSEPSSSSPYSYFTPHSPLIDFSQFLHPAEPTVQRDLVLYFNLANHHVPHAGDVPATLAHLSGSAVMFSPVNAFPAAWRERVSGVRIDADKKEEEEREKGYHVRYFGGRYGAEETLQGHRLEADLSGWNGGGKVGPWWSGRRHGSGEGKKGDGRETRRGWFIPGMNPWVAGFGWR